MIHAASLRFLAAAALALFPLAALAQAATAAAAAPATAAASPAAGRLDTRLSATPSRIVPVDRIVAVVNDDVITQNDLSERVGLVVRQLQRQGGELPPSDALARQILERMINDRVQLQLAKDNGVKVDEPTLDKTIERIAQENGLQVPAFREALEKDGIKYPRFRDDIRNEITIARLREHDVDNAVVVTDAEVETELAREARESSGDTEYHLSHILVTVPAQATPEQIDVRRRRAVEALTQLRGGANFAKIAAQYSDAPDALQGGDLGWRASGRLPGIFLDVLKRMQPGDVSDLMRSPNGFHIVRLSEKRAKAAATGIQQTHVRHILLRAREGLSESEARDKLAKMRERIAGRRRLRRPRQAELGGLERFQGRRPGLGRARRHGARVREGDGRAQARRGEPAVPDPVRMAPRAGRGAPLRGALGGPQEDRRAPGDPRAQGRRGLPGLAAPAARPRVRREPLRRALKRREARARPCPIPRPSSR